jgi:hypothetical protein
MYYSSRCTFNNGKGGGDAAFNFNVADILEEITGIRVCVTECSVEHVLYTTLFIISK